MAPTSKDTEVLAAPPETASTVSTAARPRFDETATASRPQPVALEVPVTVNGARTVEGSDKREPFSETTKTVLVFGNGAVIRLGSPVAAGQLLFLTNEKTKKEVVCQVVKSKNYKSVSGYVELEFTESVVGFWGMRFPSDRIGSPAPAPISSLPPAAKSKVVGPVATAPSPVVPIANSAPRVSEVKPASIQAARVQAEVKPTPPPQLAGVSLVPPPAAKVLAQVVDGISSTIAPVASVASAPPVAKKPEAPVAATPEASSLASSLASLLGAPDVPVAVTSSRPPAAPVGTQDKPPAPNVAVESSTEELKVQAARLQEQLSSLLFSAAPPAKSATAAPVVAATEPKAVSGAAARVLEIAKSEPSPVKVAAPAKPLPPPIKSSLDTEEVKIPSWLEPLARNAAAPPTTQLPVERERDKQVAEIAAHEAHAAETLPLTAEESVPESSLPGIGNLLPLDEPVITHERPSGGHGRGALYGAIAAGVLLVAGGAWYFLHQPNATSGTPGPVASAPSSQANVTPSTPSVIQPASPVAAQNSRAVSVPNSGTNSTPVSDAPTPSLTGGKSPVSSQSAPVTRDNTRGAGTTIPAAATERISRPPAEPAPAPKKPALGDVHLASPTMNRAAAQEDGAEAPSISSGNTDAISGGLDSGLAVGNAKQPAAPEAPLPIGGDVKSAKLISKVDPLYPTMAKNQHIAGDIRVDALIDANGRVTTMKVISGPALLHQAAMDALRQWKYQPATLDGKAVPMHLTVTIQFRLQ